MSKRNTTLKQKISLKPGITQKKYRKQTLAETIETLAAKIKQLAATAKEKEHIKRTLATTSKRLEKSYALLEQQVDTRTKDLRNSNIAAQNVLEDLAIEKTKVDAARAKEEAILLSVGDGLLVTDEKGRIVLVNKAAEKLLDKKSEELIGKIFSEVTTIEDERGELVLPEDRPMSRALAGKATITTAAGPTYYYIQKGRATFPVAITVTPVMLDGKVIGAIEVFRDITKEKEVDKAKTEFVSLASHQLRTPLSSVRWYSEMLLDGDAGVFNEKQTHYLEEIHRGNLRMIELVNTLLQVSRLELGTIHVHLENVDLSKTVEEVLNDLQDRKKKQDVAVEVALPKTLGALMTDATLLRIVIENLISNAIKYSKMHGTVKITAQEVPANESFADHVANDKSIGLSIVDNGIGIPATQHVHIFEKLFRAENAQEADTDGAGLGLYLTKLVLGSLKGQIWFTSHAGKGTTFYVLLPYAALKPEI